MVMVLGSGDVDGSASWGHGGGTGELLPSFCAQREAFIRYVKHSTKSDTPMDPAYGAAAIAVRLANSYCCCCRDSRDQAQESFNLSKSRHLLMTEVASRFCTSAQAPGQAGLC
jgi:hypothetical protein